MVDLETTGLFPPESNRILEIGILAVSEPDFVEIDAWSTPILHDMKVIAGMCNDFVWNMHKESGLVEELRKMNVGERPAVAAKQALLEALAFIHRHSEGCGTDERGRPEIFLCGANPDFDRRYLESWMPDLAKRFHYRTFDVNSLFLLRRWLLAGPRTKFGTAHRSLADCRQALAGIHEFVQDFAAALGGVHAERIAELETQIARTQEAFAADWAARGALAGVP